MNYPIRSWEIPSYILTAFRVGVLETLGHLKHPPEISYIYIYREREDWLHGKEIGRHMEEERKRKQEKESGSHKQTDDSALRIHG
jgi:hypothetical protein